MKKDKQTPKTLIEAITNVHLACEELNKSIKVAVMEMKRAVKELSDLNLKK